jgi:zinc protease
MTTVRCRIIAFILAAALVPSAIAQEDARRRAVQHTVLENGLDVLVVENHTVALATVLLAVRSGAFTQAQGEEGLAHLQEHVLFRAFKNDASAFGEEVASLNGAYNGSTGEDVVSYYIVTPSENADKAVRLLADLIRGARLQARHLTEERPVVRDELARDRSRPELVLGRQVSQALWRDAWHRQDVAGDSASLERVTLDRLEETFTRYYVPNNSALVVTGDVSTAAVRAAAEQYFGDWQRGPDPFGGAAPAPIEPLGADQVITLPGDVSHFSIVVELRGPCLHTDTADTYAVNALVASLNQPGSAFRAQLVGSGMFQDLDVQYRALKDVGQITFSGRTVFEWAQPAVAALVAALDEPTLLLTVSDEDIATARKQQALERAIALEYAATLAPSLAAWWASAGIDYYVTYQDRLNQQTAEDLRRVTERYIIARPRAIGVHGTPDVADSVASWLRRTAAASP